MYTAVVVKVNNIICRTLLDTGAGSFYASSALLEKLNVKPVRKEAKRIEMIIHSTIRKIYVFQVKIKDFNLSFEFKSEVSKVERNTTITASSRLRSSFKTISAFTKQNNERHG